VFSSQFAYAYTYASRSECAGAEFILRQLFANGDADSDADAYGPNP
jgi:hypothetical protein